MISFKKYEDKIVFYQDNKLYSLIRIYDNFVIKENIDISELGLKELPDLSNLICLGNFDCSWNNLTSLKGAPKEVKGLFNCSGNNIISLEYGPKKAKIYDCSSNNLRDLQGAPEELEEFNCGGNNIISLEYGPKKAKIYDCSSNNLRDLQGAPEEVELFDCSENKLKSLIGGPKKARSYYCRSSLKSFDGAPTDCDNFFVYKSSLSDKKLKSKKDLELVILRIKNGKIKVR